MCSKVIQETGTKGPAPMQIGNMESTGVEHSGTPGEDQEDETCRPCLDEEERVELIAALQSDDPKFRQKKIADLNRKFGKKYVNQFRKPSFGPKPTAPNTNNGATNTAGMNGTGRETRTCHYCGKPGHLIKNCRIKSADVQKGIHRRSINEVEVTTQGMETPPEPNWFIGNLSMAARNHKKHENRKNRRAAAQTKDEEDERAMAGGRGINDHHLSPSH